MKKQTLEKIYNFLVKIFFYRIKKEIKSLIFRKSTYALNNIKKVEEFIKYNIKVIRLALGASLLFCDRLINRIFATNIKEFLPANINILKKNKNYLINY